MPSKVNLTVEPRTTTKDIIEKHDDEFEGQDGEVEEQPNKPIVCRKYYQVPFQTFFK